MTPSILYKTRLPFILVFNKTDVQKHDFALEWMDDFEAFQEALASKERRDADGEQTYMSSLMNSMSLVLDEFYKGLKVISVFPLVHRGLSVLLGCGCICCHRGRNPRVFQGCRRGKNRIRKVREPMHVPFYTESWHPHK